VSFPSRRLSLAAAIPAIGLTTSVVVLWLRPLPHAADQYLPFFRNRSLADPTAPLEVFHSVWLFGWLSVFAVFMLVGGACILRTRLWLGFAVLAFGTIGLPIFLTQFLEAVGAHWWVDGGPPAAIRVDDETITCRSEAVSVAVRDVRAAHVSTGPRAQTAVVLAVASPGEAQPREVRCATTYLDVAATDIVAAIERRRTRMPVP
jgi:hypothetical protein